VSRRRDLHGTPRRVPRCREIPSAAPCHSRTARAAVCALPTGSGHDECQACAGVLEARVVRA
jgi:hypothetical protein